MKTSPSDNTAELSLAEVAAYLGWTIRFVERLAVGGQLPAREVGGQWRFRRQELVDWLDRKMQTLDPLRVADLDWHFAPSPPEPASARLTDRMDPAAVELDLRVDGREDVLRALVSVAARTGRVGDAAALLAAVTEREKLCSTALPGGVAIVHPRRPLPRVVSRPLLAFARSAQMLDFGAADGEGTGLYFLLTSSDERDHLHSLARLVRLLRIDALEVLRQVESAAEVIGVLRRAEADVEACARPRNRGPERNFPTA